MRQPDLSLRCAKATCVYRAVIVSNPWIELFIDRANSKKHLSIFKMNCWPVRNGCVVSPHKYNNALIAKDIAGGRITSGRRGSNIVVILRIICASDLPRYVTNSENAMTLERRCWRKFICSSAEWWIMREGFRERLQDLVRRTNLTETSRVADCCQSRKKQERRNDLICLIKLCTSAEFTSQ
jgi:hypothetical protein